MYVGQVKGVEYQGEMSVGQVEIVEYQGALFETGMGFT